MKWNDISGCMLNLPDKKGYKMWRKPTFDELKLMYKHRKLIETTSRANGGSSFRGEYYWSSKEKYGDQFSHYVGWISSGSFLTETAEVSEKHSLRAVRDF